MLDIGSDTSGLFLEDSDGTPSTLTDLSGGRGVLVYFMRSASCPVCNNHARRLARQEHELDALGVRAVIAVPDGGQAATEWKRKTGTTLTTVTGRTGTLHESVGLGTRVFGSMQQSGTLLVDRSGAVRYARAATMPTSGYNASEALAAVQRLTSQHPH